MSSNRKYFVLASVMGATAVALGAFGAHGLKSYLMNEIDSAARMEWWKTGSYYQLTHALLSLFFVHFCKQRASKIGLMLVVLGTLFFSGSLYWMTITNQRIFGIITPIGGLCFIGAWICVAFIAQGAEK